jgi:hypothetical protein
MLLRELFLIDGYKEAQSEFSKLGRPESVKDMISKFRQLVDRNQVQGEERNIDVWRRKGWYEFQRFVFDKSQEQSKTQKKKLVKREEDAVTVFEQNNITGIMPLNKNASINIGRHSDWCTTKAEHKYWEEYTGKGVILIYCFLNYEGDGDGDDMWAIAFYRNHPTSVELFTASDEPITAAQFLEETGVPAHEIIRAALNNRYIDNVEVEPKKKKKTKTYNDTIIDKLTINRHAYTGKRDPEIEYALLHFFDRTEHNDFSDRSFHNLLRTYTTYLKPADIQNMDPLFQNVYLSEHPEFIEFISNPTPEQVKRVVTSRPQYFEKIQNPTYTQIKILLDASPDNIRFIKNANVKVQAYAMNRAISLGSKGLSSFIETMKPSDIDPRIELALAKQFPNELVSNTHWYQPSTYEYFKQSDPERARRMYGLYVNGEYVRLNHT